MSVQAFNPRDNAMAQQAGKAVSVEERIDSLLKGAIDPHVHSGPSIALRDVDHLELLRDLSAAGFAAVVTKDHDYSGVMTAALIKKHHPDLRTKLYSSIVLNNVVGGFNPYAVEHTAAMGGKVVWLPTLAAENHLRWEKTSNWVHPASTQKMRPAVGIPVLDSARAVRDDVKEILDIVARNDMVLASGHLHVSETWLVFEEAKRRGVNRIVLTHPEDIVDATMNDVSGIAKMGAFIEHSLCMFVKESKLKVLEAEDLRKHIEGAGVDNTIMSTDLGQTGNIRPLEGFRLGIAMCLDLGYSEADIRKMFSTNAARLFGLESLVEKVAA